MPYKPDQSSNYISLGLFKVCQEPEHLTKQFGGNWEHRWNIYLATTNLQEKDEKPAILTGPVGPGPYPVFPCVD